MPRDETHLRLREWEQADRLAGHITDTRFPVAPRTIAETWPIAYVIVNKRKLLNTAEALAHAESVLAAAVARAARGGTPADRAA
jgi:hypothetical protein